MKPSTRLSILALFAATNLGIVTVQAGALDVGATVGAVVSTGESVAADTNSNIGASVNTGSDSGNADVKVGADVKLGAKTNPTKAKLKLETGVGIGTETGDADAGANANVDLAATTGSNAAADVNADIDAFTIVKVDGTGAAGDVDVAINALTDMDDAEFDDLRAQIGADADVVAALDADGLSLGDILGLVADEDGGTTIFVADGPIPVACDASTASSIKSDATSDDIANADEALIASLSGCSGTSATISAEQLAMVEANSALTSEIQTQGYESTDILAVDSAGGDTLKIFVRAEG